MRKKFREVRQLPDVEREHLCRFQGTALLFPQRDDTLRSSDHGRDSRCGWNEEGVVLWDARPANNTEEQKKGPPQSPHQPGPELQAHIHKGKCHQKVQHRTSWWHSRQESACNAGDTGLIQGLGRLHKLRSNWGCVPQLLSPCSATRRDTTMRSPHCSEELPHLLHLESPQAATKTQSVRPKISIFFKKPQGEEQ